MKKLITLTKITTTVENGITKNTSNISSMLSVDLPDFDITIKSMKDAINISRFISENERLVTVEYRLGNNKWLLDDFQVSVKSLSYMEFECTLKVNIEIQEQSNN